MQAFGTQAAGYRTNGCTGVCVDELYGHVWVSTRQDGNNPNLPHKLMEFWWDPKTNGGRGAWHVEIYDQPAALTTASSWGIRDLCTGAGATSKFIYGSAERTATGDVVYAFDVTKPGASNRSVGWTAAANWRTSGVDSSITTIRALAYHAARDTMFTASFDSVVSEFRRDGTQVQAWQPSRKFSTYGFAYDPTRQTLLATGQSGSTYPGVANAMVCYEIDPRIPGGGLAKETGTMFFAADRTIQASRVGGFSGGCHLHVEQQKIETTTKGVYNTIEVPVLTWLHQASSDTLTRQYGRVEHVPHIPGNGVALPRNTGGFAGTGGDVPFLGNGSFQITLRGSQAQLAFLVASSAAHNVLTPFGSILVDPDLGAGFMLVAPMNVVGGRAALTVPIPNSSGLAGAPVFVQWAEATGTLSTGAGFSIVK